MHIGWHSDSHFELNISLEEAKKYLAVDAQTVQDLTDNIQKFVTSIEDAKRIYTKQLLDKRDSIEKVRDMLE